MNEIVSAVIRRGEIAGEIKELKAKRKGLVASVDEALHTLSEEYESLLVDAVDEVDGTSRKKVRRVVYNKRRKENDEIVEEMGKRKSAARGRKCGKCGKIGHNSRTCPERDS